MSTNPIRPPVKISTRENPEKEKKISPWSRELYKFLYRQVTIDFLIGNETKTVSGQLVAFQAYSMHCIVDTDYGESIMIRHPLRIIRERKHQPEIANA